MVAVARDHLAKLFERVLHDDARRLAIHALEGVAAPGGDLGLDEDAVAVAVVEHAAILLPVHARVDAVEVLHVGVVVIDPRRRLGHAVFRIAPGHAFDSHEADALAVQVEAAIAGFDPANAEAFGEFVTGGEAGVQAIEVWVIEVPEAGLIDGGGPGVDPGGFAGFDYVTRGGAAVDRCEAGGLVDCADIERALGGLSAAVADEGADAQFGPPRRQVGIGIDLHSFDEDFRGDEQADGTVDAAVVGPVARAAAGKHAVVERVLDAHPQCVQLAEAQQTRDVERERGVAFAQVLAGGLVVHPHHRRMEYGFEFDPDGGGRPLFGRLEGALIPTGAVIVGRGGLDLPCVRNGGHFPVRLCVEAELPVSVEGNAFCECGGRFRGGRNGQRRGKRH